MNNLEIEDPNFDAIELWKSFIYYIKKFYFPESRFSEVTTSYNISSYFLCEWICQWIGYNMNSPPMNFPKIVNQLIYIWNNIGLIKYVDNEDKLIIEISK